MLQNVRFRDFRCFRSLDAPLCPLTILVGPNDSGKSAFLAGLNYLARVGPLQIKDFWRFLESSRPSVEGRTKAGVVHVNRNKSRQDQGVADLLQPTSFFQLPSQGVAMQCDGYPDHGPLPALEENGQRVPALLDHLLRRDRKRFDAFVESMRGLVPGFEDVQIATPAPDRRRVDLLVEKGLRISANDASTGMRLLLFFVALAHHPSPPRLILLEEPENGIHPKRLGDVMRLLTEITQGKHGDHPAQIVLTTHSPHLLDYVKLEHDQVLVFRREDDGSRTAKPVDASRLKNFLGEFMLGEVWFNEGEAGLVGRDT